MISSMPGQDRAEDRKMLTLTITTTAFGAPCQIEVDLDVNDEGDAWDVDKATLVHLLPYVKYQGKFYDTNPVTPDFTPCKDLNLPLDPSEVQLMCDEEIDDAIPHAMREAEQAALDSEREDRELDYVARLRA